METIVIDGADITTREALHSRLALCLGLRDYYGRNLDALYDCLTERQTDTRLEVRHISALEAALGGYAGALLDTLRDAAGENPRLEVEFFRE